MNAYTLGKCNQTESQINRQRGNLTNRETYRQREWHAGGYTGRDTLNHADNGALIHTYIHTYIHTDTQPATHGPTYIYIYGQRNRQRDRQSESQTMRQAEIRRLIENEVNKDLYTEWQTDRGRH